jgi:2-polyprenyl-3-methyl-5-hydroxy-6-metoxy-1,4-benzoquinol methylase
LVRTLPYPTFEYEDNQGYAHGYAGREKLFTGFARQFLRFVEQYAPGPRLLEVGSGMGFLLHEARRRGFTAQGLEVNRWEVDLTRAQGLDVRAGTLEDAQVPPGSVDVVCMSHVLEHVHDLHSLLSAAHQAIRPGGILAVSQPHYDALVPRVLGHRWYGWQWEQHLWHFDVPALTRILAAHDLERVGVQYNALHHPWLPQPMSWRPKVLAVQAGTAALSRLEPLFGRRDQFFLAARRVDGDRPAL